MPELPEVETIRQGLNQFTCHQPILGGEVLLPRTIAAPNDPEAFLKSLQGCTIVQWQRRGKYLLAELNQGTEKAGWWGVHLRMTGQLLWLDATEPLQRHTRIRIFFARPNKPTPPVDPELRFVDIRTFGQMWRVFPDRQPPDIITGLKTLGPEPLSEAFTADFLSQRLQRTHRPLKTALLDQSVVAGLGNIYADEALFLSGFSPTQWSDRLNADQARKLKDAIVQVLQTGIEQGGTTLKDYRNLEGLNGNYSNVAWVYRRRGQPCRTCATPIERLKLGGRSTHFCPHCQPESF